MTDRLRHLPVEDGVGMLGLLSIGEDRAVKAATFRSSRPS